MATMAEEIKEEGIRNVEAVEETSSKARRAIRNPITRTRTHT